MEKRPNLDRNITLADFNDFYWLKEELVDFCKRVGISTSGGKIEISDKIRHYILTGKTDKIEAAKSKGKSKFDWSKEKLTLKTEITDSYKNGENVRSFFIQEIGSHFAFNVIFMKWIKENTAKNIDSKLKEEII